MTTPGTPRYQTIHQMIDGLAGAGDAPLLVAWGDEGPREWSYGEVARQVGALAAGLRERIEPQEPVVILADEGAEWLLAALAVMCAGGVVTPLDVQLEGDTLSHVLRDSGARLAFVSASRREKVERSAPGLETLLLDPPEGDAGWRKLLADAPGEFPAADPDTPAALFYTSGTTGPPKGVPLSHGNLVFQLTALAEAEVVRAGDRVLLPLPLHHVYPFVIGMLGPIALGLTIVLPRSLTGPQVLRAVRESGVSVIVGVPRLYSALFAGVNRRAGQGGRLAAGLFRALLGLSRLLRRRLGMRLGRQLLYPLHARLGPRLRVLASGGSALDPELAWNLEALGWQVATGYGLTETSPLLTIDPPRRPRIGSVGRPVPGVELRLDPEAAPEAQRDAGEGEILARGPNVFAGYRHLPDKSDEAFSDGWFRTGDLGRLDRDGYVYVTGRASTLIVTAGGENIQPDALEERYAASPAIREIAVLQHDGRLVGLAVPERAVGDEDSAQAVRAAVSEAGRDLPSYQRLEDVAVTRSPLPRTRLGKLKRHRLPERFAQAREEGAGAMRPEPLDPSEWSGEDRSLLDHEAARGTWQWLTERYPDKGLSPDSSPQLDLGVDSMEWLDLTMDIGQRTGVELEEDVIARIESVRDLLREVVEGAGRRGGAVTDVFDDPLGALDERQRRWLHPPGRAARAGAYAMYVINRLLMRGLFRVRAYGGERVPADGPLLLVASHASHLDPFVLAAVLPYARLRSMFWAGWTGVTLANPLTRAGSRLARVIPVDPEQGVRSSLALSAAVLQAGAEGLIWFPEGERSPDGELLPFRPGIGLLLERYPVPVVFASIHGAYEALPRNRVWPRLRRIEVRFSEPVEAAALREEGAGDKPAARIVEAMQRRMRALRD